MVTLSANNLACDHASLLPVVQAFATNSQNPVDLRDLRSNDEIQKQFESGDLLEMLATQLFSSQLKFTDILG